MFKYCKVDLTNCYPWCHTYTYTEVWAQIHVSVFNMDRTHTYRTIEHIFQEKSLYFVAETYFSPPSRHFIRRLSWHPWIYSYILFLQSVASNSVACAHYTDTQKLPIHRRVTSTDTHACTPKKGEIMSAQTAHLFHFSLYNEVQTTEWWLKHGWGLWWIGTLGIRSGTLKFEELDLENLRSSISLLTHKIFQE